MGPEPSPRPDAEHRPNDEYVSKMPSLPRIQLLYRYPPSSHGSQPRSSLILPDFLTRVDLSSCLTATEGLGVNWSYAYRYAAQKILPFLYLGPTTCVRDTSFLKDQGITMILTVRSVNPMDDKPLSAVLTKAQNLGIRTSVMDVPIDRPLISTFPIAVQNINNHLDECNKNEFPSSHVEIAGSVLVCCDSGSHRSAAVVIAYMMETFGLALRPAYRSVQDHRFCIAIDDTMKQSLLAYETILEARRNVADSLGSKESATAMHGYHQGDGLILSSRTSKRFREAESDVDMEDEDDRDRFEGRTFVPFSPD